MNFDACRLSGTRKVKVVDAARLGQEWKDCPAREEGDGLALSEARLCVNVWLAFGRQP